MSKTIEEIKTKWAKDHSYKNYFEFLDLTRKCDTDHVFIMDGAVTQIAKRYAQSQTQELQEQNAELVNSLLKLVLLLDGIDSTLFNHNHSIDGWHLNGDLEPIAKAKEILTKYNHLKSSTNV